MLKRLIYALGFTILGLIIGAVTLGFETGFEWIFYRITGFEEPKPESGSMSGSDGWILLGVLAFFVVVLIAVYWPSRRGHRRTKTLLGKAFAAHTYLGRVFVSEDGRYGYLPLRVSPDLWTENHKYFNKDTYETTPQLSDPGGWYYFVFVETDKKRGFKSLPSDQGECEADINVIMGDQGWRWLVFRSLLVLRWFFSQVPFLKTVTTSVCVFLMGFLKPGQRQRFDIYCRESLVPYLSFQTADLARPPRGIRIDAIEIVARRSKSSMPIIFREDAGKKFDDAAKSIFDALYLFPFGRAKEVRLQRAEFEAD